MEQILPTFNPQYTVTIKTFPEEYPEFKEDIPIIIQGVTFSDDFEAAMEQRRTIVYTLSFEMKVSFFGALQTQQLLENLLRMYSSVMWVHKVILTYLLKQSP